MIFGYCRVSSLDQNLDRQIDAIKNCGIDERLIYCDKYTGTTLFRPQLDKLLQILHEEDGLIVTSLDRLARSAKDLFDLMDLFEKRKIVFKSLKENIDLSTPTGKLILGVFAVLNEFQRSIIIENAKEGIRAAKERGKVFGRPFKLSSFDYEGLLQQIEKGKSVDEMAKEFKVCRKTIYNYLRLKK